jgi:hypothetical protein
MRVLPGRFPLAARHWCGRIQSKTIDWVAALAALVAVVAGIPAWASPLVAWRVTRAGQLELRTAPDLRPQAFFDAGTGLRGPRVWVDLPGGISPARTLRGGGALREVQIGTPDGLTTRLTLEFAVGTPLDSSGLRLVAISRDRWRMALIGLGNQAGSGIGEGDPDGLEKIQPQSPELPSRPPARFDASLDELLRDLEKIEPQSPKLPSRPPARFDASIDELVRDGVLSPAERARINSNSGMNSNASAHQQACRSGALSPQECSSGVVVRWRGSHTISGPISKPLSHNEQSLLQRIRSSSYTLQWRTYGQCKYDWAGWKLHSNGTRTTRVDCGVSAMRWTVGVSCVRLLVAAHTAKSGWSKWRAPAGPENESRQGEDEMVAALCANV